MISYFDNAVRFAVRKAGGPTRVASLLGVSGSSVHYWINSNNVPKYEMAKKLAELAGVKLETVRPCYE